VIEMAVRQGGRGTMIELTEQMRQALATSPGEPLWLVDLQTRQSYVLLRKEEYDLVKGLLGQDDGLDGVDVGALVDAAMREDDENDPLLERYREDDESA
jgi:hypothetical protein